MKFIYLISAMLIFFFAVSCAKKVSTASTEQKLIRTTAQCEMCKEKIETALHKIKGVKKAILNQENKLLAVTFANTQTEYSIICKAMTELGYDADDYKANEEAYEKLPACCKK